MTLAPDGRTLDNRSVARKLGRAVRLTVERRRRAKVRAVRHEIDAALDRMRVRPEDRQADGPSAALAMGRASATPRGASSEDEAALDEALRDGERGEFATEAEVEAVFARYRGA